MDIPFFALDRQYARDRGTYQSIADKVWSTGRVLQGPQVAGFEEACATVMGRRYAVAVGSCTDALAFAMMAAGVGAGDEVLITCYSFIASVSPVLRVGATPKFVDIDADTYLMDLDKLEAAITPQTKAILAVHLFGQTLDMAAVEAIAQRHGLVLIEDAAQAIGAHDRTGDGERPGGAMGAVSCVSFDPTKVIGSYSSAGALATDDPDVAETARRLRYHGRDAASREHVIVGFNSQLASDMAAMLSFKLGKLGQWMEERCHWAERYLQGLGNMAEISLPLTRSGSTHSYHKFVIRAQNRDALADHLQAKGIQTMKHYPSLLCDAPFVRDAVGCVAGLEVARKACGEVLSLPIYPELTGDEVEYVIATVQGFYA